MEVSKFVCRVCNKEFKYQRNIDLHLTRVHGLEREEEGKMSCPEGFCKFSFEDNLSLREHLCTVHKFEVCLACSEVFRDRRTMFFHMKKKHYDHEIQQNIICPQDSCDCSFVDYFSLTEHLRTVHEWKISSNTCLICSKSFTDRRNTYQHVRNVHGVDPQLPGRYTCTEESCECSFDDYSSLRDHLGSVHDLKPTSLSCQHCNREFRNKKNMCAHLRSVHKIKPETRANLLCPEASCKLRFKEYSYLRTHLSTEHGLVIQKDEYTFDNETDFSKWKESTENETNCFYTLQNRASHATGRNKKYYVCHRSGPKKPGKYNAKRRKNRDGVKMGRHCPSTLEVWEEEDKIRVMHYSTHFGHQNELQYLRINKSERTLLAKKLSKGVSMDKCLEETTNSSSGELKRIHLLTKKDLWNICKAEKICPRPKSPIDDITCIRNWVNEDEASQRNLTIFHKRQGFHLEPLNVEDLMLVIMSPPQREMYMKFCGSTICIESTLGVNDQEFQLTVIVVFDEFENAFPAAMCLSNRVDRCVLEIFFDAVAKATSTTASPDVFMSDDAPLFYGAWKVVNHSAKCQLLCPWHVEGSWRKALYKIPSKEKKVNVYNLACTLLGEIDVDKFKESLKCFLRELAADKQTKNFGLYFERTYANRPEAWALCYSLESGINRNAQLEAIYKMLVKHKPLDMCFDLMLKMVRDKMFSRLTQLIADEESNMTKIIHDIIRDRHEKGVELSSEIQRVDYTTWEIRSMEKASSYVHTVSKTGEGCANCPFKCSDCNVCVHNYDCTCIDYSVELNMCEHIHFLLSKLQNVSKVFEDPTIQKTVGAIISEASNSTTENLQHKIDHALSLIQENSCDTETSRKLEKLMDNAIGLLNKTGKRKTDGPHGCETQSLKLKLPRLNPIKKT